MPIVTAMNIYQQMFPNVEVVIKNYMTEEETSAYYENLAADIMAGKASDLILFRSNTFPDIYKSMEAGVFEDLILISKMTTVFIWKTIIAPF